MTITVHLWQTGAAGVVLGVLVCAGALWADERANRGSFIMTPSAPGVIGCCVGLTLIALSVGAILGSVFG